MSSQQKIAIVGIGCRFAGGVDNVDEFWKALSEGRDCSSPLPQDRFDVASFYHPDLKKTGKLYCERGGFLKHDVLKFDRQFFKMPPDEADHLDPQVRLLLEVTQEAFEDAGMPARSIKGSKTGVFMGVTACEYLVLKTTPVSHMSQYTNSGTNSCMVSNRISYEYDLNGPSFSVDTACSSSLYTTHLACEAIRRGECNMALAGGVNLLLMPNTFIGFCQAGMLAPDGRCKSFDASADGYSRGEGAGVIVLKPLDSALADNDRIYAVIRGGALTNDGHTPGIANPSYDAQVELVRRACANAAVAYADIPYVEAHGTGTQVGDTTEANALGQTIGTARKSRDTPLYIGSVKSNISHCEGSAGIAGVIKTALALQHRQIPPVVHFRRGNEKIKFDEYNLKVPQKLEPWPNKDKALAGVSSFGFGGANAHLVLEGIPGDSINSSALRKERKMAFVKPLVISAQTKEGLAENATKWISHLQKSEESFNDILSTAALRRQHYTHRVGILCRSREDAIAGLEAFVDGSERTRYVEGHVPDTQAGSGSRLVFVFNGMGTQWFGMGQTLLQAEPVFRETIAVSDKLQFARVCS
ncbi:Phthiocerol/phenolphthiocerol synthesis polyketide synthase type I PpsA [Lamellibrachia satsuma]|nr:Phthiocerol/phenolphthiocerol synthesis polyketide synthase type I PpsA [Lamellibrachia satsuma]